MIHLGKLLHEQFFGGALQCHRIAQGNAVAANHLDRHRAFIELRNELRAQLGEQPPGAGKEEKGDRHHQPPQPQGSGQQGRVKCLRASHDPAFFFTDVAAQEPRAQRGHQGERQHERAHEREHHGHRHRAEHFPFDPGERENRHIDDRDNEHAEKHGPGHFAGGTAHFRQPLCGQELSPQLMLFLRDVPQDVFDHHDGPIDNEAEVDRSEAHQIGADLCLHHAGEHEKKGERNGQCDDEGRPPIAQKGEQYNRHEDRALKEILLHGVYGRIDQIRAVIDDTDHDARREFFLNLL